MRSYSMRRTTDQTLSSTRAALHSRCRRRVVVLFVVWCTSAALLHGCRTSGARHNDSGVVLSPNRDFGGAVASEAITGEAHSVSSPSSASSPTPAAIRQVALEVESDEAPQSQVSQPTVAKPSSVPAATADLESQPAGRESSTADSSASAGSEDSDETEDDPFTIIPPEPPMTTTPVRDGITLDEVIESVYTTYPLLHASLTQRQQAAGQQLGTWGAFDLNASASSENTVAGFYENFRHKFGVSRNIYNNGGQWFSQYTLGRGEFEPWYKEREKNEGGEFQVGLIKPLKQGRDIDARRAAIWRATYEQQRVEPAIQRDLIAFVFDGSAAYWRWVAAGQRYDMAKSLLDVAETRIELVERLVALGEREKPVITENNRLVVSRRGMLIDAERQLAQAAATLSLFYRDLNGEPLQVDRYDIPTMSLGKIEIPIPEADLATAMASRPELFELNARRRQLQVTLAESRNNMLPKLDAFAKAAQDLGGKASSKDDKQEFEFEAGLFFDVPIERRSARGRIADTQGKLAQVGAELKMAQDKILVDLQVAAAAIDGAVGRVAAARESISLAKELVRVEQRLFGIGQSSLLEVTLREQQLVESTEALIMATLDLNIANAAYRAALGIDRL